MSTLTKTLLIIVVLAILIALAMLTPIGKDFYNRYVLKNLSQECGYETTSQVKKCECEGKDFGLEKFGITKDYCFGECHDCLCFEKPAVNTDLSTLTAQDAVSCDE